MAEFANFNMSATQSRTFSVIEKTLVKLKYPDLYEEEPRQLPDEEILKEAWGEYPNC